MGIINPKQANRSITIANESLVRILRAPNWFQGQGEFWRQTSLFHDIWGNEYMYFLRPFGMANSYKGLFTINPENVEIEYKSETEFFMDESGEAVKYFYVTDDGKRMPLDKENIIHLNDNRVQKKNLLKGTSKIESLRGPLENIRLAYKKRNIVLKTPIGILSNGQSDAIGQAVPMDPTEKEKAQTRLEIRGPNPIITNLAVKYDSMDIDSRKMGLFEETKEDTLKICDAYGVPYEMLAAQKGVTYANLKEAKKQFYEETIIPDAQEKVDALNLFLGTDSRTWHITASFAHLPVFAEDIKNRAVSLKQMIEALSKALADGAITLVQYKIELQKFGI